MPRKFSFYFSLLLFFSFGFFARAQVVSYDTNVKIDKGRKITEKSFLININSRDDQHLADIKIEVQSSQEFKLLEASVLDSDGEEVRKVRKRDIKTRSNLSYGSFFNDDEIKEFELYWNRYPYQIKYAYRIVEYEFVSVVGWNPVVDQDLSVQKASLRVEIPSDYPVSLDFSDQFHYEVYEEGDDKIRVWEIRDFEKSGKEMFSVHEFEIIPDVLIIPKKFKYGIGGKSDTWASFGKWYDLLNEGSLMLTVSEKIKIDKLIKDIDDKEEIVKTLYHYLQDNVRYVNVRLDIGGLKSYPAQYVCQKKYGDCKALTTYMKALLNYVGIPSNYVLIRGGFDVPRIKTWIPGQQFNHIILSVPLENDTLWLENTSGVIPFNYLGTSLQNRKALLVDRDNSKLVTLPPMSLAEVQEQRIFMFNLDKEGDGTITINQHLRGREFEKYRYFQETLDANEQQRQIENDLITRSLDIDGFSFIPADRDEHQLSILIEASCDNYFRQIGNMKVIQPPVFPVPVPEKPDKRKKSVRVNIPVNKADSMVYNLLLPENYEIDLPPDVFLDSPFGIYEARYLNNDNRIIVVNKFRLFQGNYPREGYADFYSFFKEIDKIRHQSGIVITEK